ncbi:unnamed protein product [Heligmosomoides polygyrus]|uniref:Reverse transcriptase domain-containing protein n=1 Tax=Heligmosomoides polygyrus TaxID=6339 RepID=A0A183FWS6_HELPZ|nr:unnamed protein product [Heligmosomoides polygyrus]
MGKVIHDFYPDTFDSHVHLSPRHLLQDGSVVPSVLPSEIRHAISSVKKRTAPGPDRIRPEHLNTTKHPGAAPHALPVGVQGSVSVEDQVDRLAVQEKKRARHWRLSLSVVYKLFTGVILNRISRTLDEGQPCEQAGFRRGFSTMDHICTHHYEAHRSVARVQAALCLPFMNLKKALYSVEIDAAWLNRASKPFSKNTA